MVKQSGEDRVSNKIAQKGLCQDGKLRLEIQIIFDRLGLKVIKVIPKNGESWTKGGDQVLISGPKETMGGFALAFSKRVCL